MIPEEIKYSKSVKIELLEFEIDHKTYILTN